jgi:hypothetical protein
MIYLSRSAYIWRRGRHCVMGRWPRMRKRYAKPPTGPTIILPLHTPVSLPAIINDTHRGVLLRNYLYWYLYEASPRYREKTALESSLLRPRLTLCSNVASRGCDDATRRLTEGDVLDYPGGNSFPILVSNTRFQCSSVNLFTIYADGIHGAVIVNGLNETLTNIYRHPSPRKTLHLNSISP